MILILGHVRMHILFYPWGSHLGSYACIPRGGVLTGFVLVHVFKHAVHLHAKGLLIAIGSDRRHSFSFGVKKAINSEMLSCILGHED